MRYTMITMLQEGAGRFTVPPVSLMAGIPSTTASLDNHR